MSEQNNQSKQNPASDDSYSFYWNYKEQLAHDQNQKEKKSKRGILVYACVLTSVFLIAFAMLAATIVLYANNASVPPVKEEEQSSQNLPVANAAAVSEKVNPSVVLIEAASSSATAGGTGFLFHSYGYIITNYHIVENATHIRVTLYNGERKEAVLVGYRAEDDIAVIQIEGEGYTPVTIGDSNALSVGDVAIAIGNPGGLEGGWSVSQGVVSGLNRIITVEEASYFGELKMIQTDAQVNPGNSGGPLCNASGEVIGIVTRRHTSYVGVGYAIPINEAMLTVNAIMEDKLDGFVSSVSKSRPKIGVTGVEILAGETFTIGGIEYAAPCPGFLVIETAVGTSAYGILEVGDIIHAVNGVTITGFDSFKAELYKCYVGQTVTFDIYRLDEEMTIEITIGVIQ